MQDETPKNIQKAELPLRGDESGSDAELEKLRRSSMRISRIIIPIILGLAVVGYLMWKNFDPEEFKKISWGPKTAIWMSIGLVMLVMRHLSYSYRLWILAERSFSFVKCIELIFIWLFSSAVTPTSVGGSAVALILLSKEKLSSARTAVIVLYTVVTDTFFFIITLAFLYLVLGPSMLRPDLISVFEIDRWGKTFLIGYCVMFLYGSFFAYGLFIDPHRPRQILDWVTRGKLFGRFRKQALQTGHEFVEASRDIVRRTWQFHLHVIVATILAWSCRFILLICIILAFVPGAVFDGVSQIHQFARIEGMFVIMEFSPTPGGSGIAEYAVSAYLKDFVPVGIVFIVAFIWRFLEYYSYLLIGVIIVPTWIRKVYKRSKKQKKSKADRQG
ncbi:MAG TPA: lysylphosphatidylglycerol synthase transmembrane domain-containing protein [Saprospiraceae bacterium]|nr:lysylphosphatidylglycerol synthase transmembrane domain-containing protein [Saprospiraceae bacterium]